MEQPSTDWDSIVRFRRDIEDRLRQQVREAVETVLDQELADALGSASHERTAARRGYRHGMTERRVTTTAGTRPVRVPRGRITTEDGTTREFRSELLPRYARRTRAIDEAILGCYLAGANSRRIRTALAPLLGSEHLSKSSVSRIVSRLKELFATWQTRDLSEERYAIVFMDGFHLKIRLARRVVSVPVLAALGVAEDGQKKLISLRLAISEAAFSWGEMVLDLQRRGLIAPMLLVVDGHAGLKKALERWPDVRVQRCTKHKLSNLQEHCPAHARKEMKRDYDRIIQAKDALLARAAYDAFLKKWSSLCPAVARSLEEAGLELLTFYEFPKSMWKSLRTTNAVENLNREFRRRTKTQGSFGTEDAALTLLFALVAFGQVRLRKIDGHRGLPSLIAKEWTHAA